jgi:hypothetical protein
MYIHTHKPAPSKETAVQSRTYKVSYKGQSCMMMFPELQNMYFLLTFILFQIYNTYMYLQMKIERKKKKKKHDLVNSGGKESGN